MGLSDLRIMGCRVLKSAALAQEREGARRGQGKSGDLEYLSTLLVNNWNGYPADSRARGLADTLGLLSHSMCLGRERYAPGQE